MSDRKPGLLRRLITGTWRVLDFSRRFILTVLFLIAVALLISSMLRPDLQVAERTVLVVAPVGAVVEQFSSSVADRAMARLTGSEVPEVRLRDLLEALTTAAEDPRIERVLLRLDGLQSAGQASLRELGTAIDTVRAAGKQVVAYGDMYLQGPYYLAARADEVYLHPGGALLLEGFSRYRTYFAGAFAKLGVEPRLFKAGTYKSAGEAYIRNDASDAAREADLHWLGDLWRRYLDEIAAARELDPARLQAAIDNLPAELEAAGGDLARLVLDAGLVDGLKSLDEVRELLIARGVRDDDGHSFRQIAMRDYLSVIAREQAIERSTTAPIAIVVAEGQIVDGDQPPGTVGGVSTSKLLRAAREDDAVKAVVLRIDSPGGGVFPSEQIRREVELTRLAGKPVVVSMGDVAASGGYWITTDADHVFADASTITGSIGVFSLWFNAPETMAKLGLNTDGVATTEIAGAFDPTRPYDPRVGRVLQANVDNVYADFIGKVARARETTPEAVDAIAQGRVWSGAQALANGLVDELGGLDAAVAHVRQLAGLPADARFAYVEPELSTFDRFIQNLAQSALVYTAQDMGWMLPASWMPAQAQADLGMIRHLYRLAQSGQWSTYAHCQCGDVN